MPDPMIRDVDDMVKAWRARIHEIGVTHQTVDFIAGWADGYCSKLLCGMRKPGPQTIALMNAALAIGFRPLVDEEQMVRVQGRWKQRERPLPSMPPTEHPGCVVKPS